MTSGSLRRLARASLPAAALLAAVTAACEPLVLPKTFSLLTWDDDGNRVPLKNEAGEPKTDDLGNPLFKTKEVSEVKFGGGKVVSAKELNEGREIYLIHCSSCHGRNGDGLGASGTRGLIPPPRNFAAPFVVFKFTSVEANKLPPDEDLIRTVRNGLHGTAMLQWDLSDERLKKTLQYIKTFSPRWLSDEEPAKPIEISADPFGPAKRADALKKGEALYHEKTQCAQCHPAYVDEAKYAEFLKAAGKPAGKLRPDAYWSVPKMSDQFEVIITPPDFTWHELRSVAKTPKGTEEEKRKAREDLYRVIGAGIGGTAMPTWKGGAITEEELWAVVYYVESLVELRGKPAERNAFMSKLRGK